MDEPCSSSSVDSIDGASNDEEIYDEELVEVDGENELALVPRREVRLTVLSKHGRSIVYIYIIFSRALTVYMRIYLMK